ncbi:MAG: hypothetical protein K2Y33_09380, partial [Mycolicibacterium frederiksbergense]|nr:hypothetical protein [Mycolicibacterium frederiksbergense]
MALVKPNGVLRGTRQLNQSDRQVEHRKMRQTWMQTFAGFAILNAMLAGAFWYFGALSILGIFGGIWITVILIAWFFSAKITPMAVQAYAADPSTEYGAAAIRCADRAWEQLTAHVRENYGERVVSLMKRPPVMLAPNK